LNIVLEKHAGDGNGRKAHGLENSGMADTVAKIGLNAAFPRVVQVVVGDGFEPSNRMEANNSSICQ
jgi:hypothetical protein